jgi:hypothetical protein
MPAAGLAMTMLESVEEADAAGKPTWRIAPA